MGADLTVFHRLCGQLLDYSPVIDIRLLVHLTLVDFCQFVCLEEDISAFVVGPLDDI